MRSQEVIFFVKYIAKTVNEDISYSKGKALHMNQAVFKDEFLRCLSVVLNSAIYCKFSLFTYL